MVEQRKLTVKEYIKEVLFTLVLVFLVAVLTIGGFQSVSTPYTEFKIIGVIFNIVAIILILVRLILCCVLGKDIIKARRVYNHDTRGKR